MLMRYRNIDLLGFGNSATHGKIIDGMYYPTSAAGLFSVLTGSLYNLACLQQEILKINSKYCLFQYKDGSANEDIWDTLFAKPDTSIDITDCHIEKIFYPHLIVHSPSYSFLDGNIHLFNPWVDKYFRPSTQVEATCNNLIKKYNIVLADTISIHYRGTDKTASRPYTPIQTVIDSANGMIEENPNLRVLIQSDQKDITDFLIKTFGDRSFYFNELPFSKSNTVPVHEENNCHFRLKYGIDYLASIIIISQTKHVITHVGNGGFWTCLYRKSLNNLLVL